MYGFIDFALETLLNPATSKVLYDVEDLPVGGDELPGRPKPLLASYMTVTNASLSHPSGVG